MSSDPSSSSMHVDPFISAMLQVPGFGSLSPIVLDDLARIASPHHYHGGQVIFLEGEPAVSVHLLVKGWVKATRMSSEGREQAMLFLRPFEIFGDIGVFTGTPYPGTTTALEAVDTWWFPADQLMLLVHRHPELALAVIHKLGNRVLHYIELVEDLSLRSVEARLASTLLQYAETSAGRIIVPRRGWTTFDEMAVRLGTVRDVLSRALKTLELEGLLKVEKQAIVLLDTKRLAERGHL